MNVANLELCKELYELSGWGQKTSLKLYKGKDRDLLQAEWSVPRYDLGYLLRKLPALILDRGDEFYLSLDKNAEDDYMVSYSGENAILVGSPHGDTPEDAACRLAIELFKSGVLVNDLAASGLADSTDGHKSATNRGDN